MILTFANIATQLHVPQLCCLVNEPVWPAARVAEVSWRAFLTVIVIKLSATERVLPLVVQCVTLHFVVLHPVDNVLPS